MGSSTHFHDDTTAGTDLNRASASFWFVALVAAGIILIGTRFLVVPLPAAAAFGVPADGGPTLAYLWAKGSRDIVSGLLVVALLWTHARRRVIAAFMAVAALIPFADLVNVYLNAGTSNLLALEIHGGTAVGMLGLAALLSPRRHRTVNST